MDEDKMKELMEKFKKNFPIEFTALHGESRNNYHDIDMFHSYACHVAIDGFDFHKEEKKEMPSLFLIPFEKKLVTPRGNQFLNMGKDIEVLQDDHPDRPFAVMYIGCCFTNTLSKNLAVKVISGMLDDFNAKYYAFISEAWCVKAGEGKEVPIKKLDVMPSEHPDRQEILMISTSGINNTTIMTTKPIRDNMLIHSEGNRVQTNGEDTKEQGRFSNLFKEIRAESKPN